MEETLTLREFKSFLNTHKAIKHCVLAEEAKLSKPRFKNSKYIIMRLLKNEGDFNLYADRILKAIKKYGYKQK